MLDIVLLDTMHSTGVVPGSESYSEALAQAAYLDEHGASNVILGEHHNTPNSYLPSPMVLGAAIAARTKNMRLNVMAVAPLLDPIRLAEDAVVLDNISNGRLELNMLLGYRKSEFAMFGTEQSERVRRTEATTAILRQAFTGEPFEYKGQTIQVTPKPVQPTGPVLLIGGATDRSAKRAARIGDGFYPSGGPREEMRRLEKVYFDECDALGKKPGPTLLVNDTLHVQVSEDPERTWNEIAPHCFSDAEMYARWAHEAGDMLSPYSSQSFDLAGLKATGLYLVLTPAECIGLCKQLEADGDAIVLSPQTGGIPPKVGWEGLELFVNKVLPALK